MKQSERRERSTSNIVACAFQEFAEHGYARASVEGVCNRGHISKGLMYHYFSGRDSLFCACAERMFSALGVRLGEYLADIDGLGARELLEGFFLCRQRFFAENPAMLAVFEDAVLHTPPQLAREISRLREPVRRRNLELLRALLSRLRLREGVSEEDAAEWFNVVESMLPEMLSRVYGRNPDAGLEASAGRLLGFLLYGLAIPE